MTQPKKLIEVAMPIKEISAESVRDKSIRHGHISTLHLWWARRPLPVCRAVVFASLVPDPLDPDCPPAFREAVELLLGKEHNPGDPYKPYADIPWTSVYDPMEDNLRNRLQMFIGKFTDDMQQHLLHHKPKPDAKNQISPFSLIKWENKNDEAIIGKARKLIRVAHQALQGNKATAAELLADFDQHYKAIKDAETALYGLMDRHLETKDSGALKQALEQAIDAFLDRMPKVFDPFAGGGAIPLEAARLGCKSYGNDINPVAHIIQKGSLEFPQKYGKPITFSVAEFEKLYGAEALTAVPNEWKVYHAAKCTAIRIPNRLSFDVEYYAKKLLAAAEQEIGHFYPSDAQGNKPIAYYWARVGTCSNPSCGAEVPLLKGFYLANTKSKQVYLKPSISGQNISFEIKYGSFDEPGWNNRGNLNCPVCSSITDVKKIKDQSVTGNLSERLVAVIVDGQNGKEYRLPTDAELEVVKLIPETERPQENMMRNSAGGDTFSWGITKWGQMFSPRQLLAMHTLVEQMHRIRPQVEQNSDADYAKAVMTYLGILMDRVAPRLNMFGLWNTKAETLEHIFGRQAIPMVFDYPESNVFSPFGGGLQSQVEWITKYIEIESSNPFSGVLINSESGDISQFARKTLTAVVTDPPYYDAIAYADLSDFFYVWLKRTIGDIYPMIFATPQTPKAEECTALKHHHNGEDAAARRHFENKLLHIFDSIEQQTSDVVSIMFAHQSTEAWTTLCNSILGARLNITGSWAIDTERTSGTKTDKAFLSSSVTVSARPADRKGVGNFRQVRDAISTRVAQEVEELYRLGFRGADLLTACFGQAVSEFGKYESVEKADGSEVTVAELLEMARESAFNALLKGFDGDEFTKFYIGWLQLNGFAESDFDDAAKFTKVGLTIDVKELFQEHILIKNGNKQTLGTYAQRVEAQSGLGEKADSRIIDQVHKGMHLFQGNNRPALLKFIQKVGDSPDAAFWRVLTSLLELLPSGCDDHKQASGLLANKESLLREARAAAGEQPQQSNLFS
jgi:putative DNA methylase